MNESNLIIELNSAFNFLSTINSHGWVALAPYRWDTENDVLSYVVQLNNRSKVHLKISCDNPVKSNVININLLHHAGLDQRDKKEIENQVRFILRLDEIFEPFYKICINQGKPWSELINGRGRLLRSPTIFEDLVKTICTINIQWGGTKRMVKELVNAYGSSFNGQTKLKTFPAPQSIMSDSFEMFCKKVNLGYRANYIYLLAKNVSNNEIDLATFLNNEVSTETLKKKLLAIKGIGNYAAATMLMLLGRYDELPFDTVFKEFVSNKYFPDGKYSETKAKNFYDRWGRWKYLAYWYDMENSE